MISQFPIFVNFKHSPEYSQFIIAIHEFFFNNFEFSIQIPP